MRPPAYIDSLLRAIVGFELTIDNLEGKSKLSQNRDGADHDGVRDGAGARRPWRSGAVDEPDAP